MNELRIVRQVRDRADRRDQDLAGDTLTRDIRSRLAREKSFEDCLELAPQITAGPQLALAPPLIAQPRVFGKTFLPHPGNDLVPLIVHERRRCKEDEAVATGKDAFHHIAPDA